MKPVYASYVTNRQVRQQEATVPARAGVRLGLAQRGRSAGPLAAARGGRAARAVPPVGGRARHSRRVPGRGPAAAGPGRRARAVPRLGRGAHGAPAGQQARLALLHGKPAATSTFALPGYCQREYAVSVYYNDEGKCHRSTYTSFVVF